MRPSCCRCPASAPRCSPRCLPRAATRCGAAGTTTHFAVSAGWLRSPRRSGKSMIVTRRQAAHDRLRDAAYHWARVAAQRDACGGARGAGRGHVSRRAVPGPGRRPEPTARCGTSAWTWRSRTWRRRRAEPTLAGRGRQVQQPHVLDIGPLPVRPPRARHTPPGTSATGNSSSRKRHHAKAPGFPYQASDDVPIVDPVARRSAAGAASCTEHASSRSWDRSARPTWRLTGPRPGGCASGSAVSTRCGPGKQCASRLTVSGPITGSRTLRRVRRAFRGRRHDLVREPDAGNPHVRFDERRLEKPPGTATPSLPNRHRASRRLYPPLPQTTRVYACVSGSSSCSSSV